MENNEQRSLEETGEEGVYEAFELSVAEPDLVVRLFERFRYVIVAVLAVLALVSLFPLKDTFSSPDTYASTIETLDEKKANVTTLVASSTALSAGISLLPDDTGSAIADKLMDLSVDLGVVLIVIYLEKYLLTILGFVTFGILAPVGLAALAAAVALQGSSAMSRTLTHIAARLLLLGAVLVAVVPTSVWITDRIDETYMVSTAIETTTEQPEAETEEQLPQEDAGESQEETGGGSILDFFAGIPEAVMSIPETVANIPQAISEGVTSVTQDVLDQVNALVESFAVMVVTSCVVPILVLVFFLWVANMLLGIKVEIPVATLKEQARGARRDARSTVTSVRNNIKKSE